MDYKIKILLFVFGVTILNCNSQEKKPNIVFILADDCTKYDIGCYGSKDSKTPTIDMLASKGIKFNNCYQHAPMCSPTRHSIYTGLYPVKSGAHPNHTYAKEGVKSASQYLNPLGYRVALSGKRHIMPEKIFDFEYLDGGHTRKELNPDFDKVDLFLSDVTEKKENFCLFLCSTEPHGPWDKGDRSLFDREKITLPPHFADTPLTRTQYRDYLAEINYLDGQVKEMLELLKKHKIDDNTLVIFASEQGYGFPFAKWTCYNAGLTSALIAYWPNHIKQGIQSDAIVEYVDILPTIIDIAGGKISSELDGKTLTGLFKNPRKKHKKYTHGLQTTRGIALGAEYFPIRTVSDGTYRLILNLTPEMKFKNSITTKSDYFEEWSNSTNPKDKELAYKYINRPAMELYNDKKDIYNQHNLIDDPKYKAKISELEKELKRWMKECGDKGLETELSALPNMRHSMKIDSAKVDLNFHAPLKKGNLNIDTKGYYTFYLKGNGKLFVDGQLLVKAKKITSKIGYHGVIGLLPGKHIIKVSNDELEVSWSGPEIDKKTLKL